MTNGLSQCWKNNKLRIRESDKSAVILTMILLMSGIMFLWVLFTSKTDDIKFNNEKAKFKKKTGKADDGN